MDKSKKRIKETRIRRGYRKIHRTEGIWQYKVHGWEISIFSPTNKKISIVMADLAEYKGWEWTDFERACNKGYHAGVEPNDIINHIETLPLSYHRW